LDSGAGVFFGEAEVEGVFPVRLRDPAPASGEAVDEPGEFGKVGGLDDPWLGR
jgi:hypothetical protein